MRINKHYARNILVISSMTFFSGQAALAESDLNISGWLNEGLVHYDDGMGSDVVQVTDNGTLLSSRITFTGSTDLPNTGLTAGFEVILEPQAFDTPVIFSNQDASLGSGASFGDTNGHALGVLGNSINIGGSWGKVTVGLQTMPSDNIAVLADPTLTFWSAMSPVYTGNGFTIRGLGGAASNTVWGDFLNCLTTPGLQGAGGVGIDCNGLYRNGVRYDLPQLVEGLGIAVGYANDDVYDVAAKWNGEVIGLQTNLHLGYAINQGANGSNITGSKEAENFQAQLGLLHPGTGLFGSFSYQHEAADGGTVAADGDDTDAYYLKAGIKRSFFSIGDTVLSFQYGSYNDQYGDSGANGITGSEVERIGFSIDQYFGSSFDIYLSYENLSLDVDCAVAATCAVQYGGAEDLDTLTLGALIFF